MSDFEEAKAFLSKDENGTNLFDHMSEVLLKVLTERPDDAVALFEQLSSSVKSERFQSPSGSSTVHDPQLVAEYSKAIAKLHKVEGEEEEPEEGTEEEEPAPAPRAEVIADLEQESLAWNGAGIHINSSDLLKLQLSLARLAGADDSIETLKVWGILHGKQASYYVAEGRGGSVEEDEDAPSPEEEANKHTYWVCTSAGGAWTQLPPVLPEQIIVARQLKRFLTGDLGASVNGYPAFPGTEKHYLRALIALINADCAIAPKGYFVLGEDESSVEVAEEYEFPSSGDLGDVSAWEVCGLPFSSLGRVTPLLGEDEEGNETSQPEGWETQWLRQAEPEDWTVRTHPQTLAASKSAKVILRSRKWPGFYAVGSPSTSTWTNIYVGYGYPKSGTLYTPPMPPTLQQEFDVTGLQEQADVIEDPTPPEEAAEEAE